MVVERTTHGTSDLKRALETLLAEARYVSTEAEDEVAEILRIGNASPLAEHQAEHAEQHDFERVEVGRDRAHEDLVLGPLDLPAPPDAGLHRGHVRHRGHLGDVGLGEEEQLLPPVADARVSFRLLSVGVLGPGFIEIGGRQWICSRD